MAFEWTNLSKNTLRELARATGLKVTKAEEELRARYGETPDASLITDTWLVLRDGWVMRTPEARVAIVDQLRAARLGNAKIKVSSRSGQMTYLRTCRMSNTLQEIVHQVLLDVGSQPFDKRPEPTASSSDSTKPATAGRLLNEACRLLDPQGLAFLEHAVCVAIGSTLRGITLPVQEDEAVDLAASITTNALVAAAQSSANPVTWEGPVPEHRAWLVAGAQRLADDPALCDRLVQEYFTEVAGVVAAPRETLHAQLICTSLFFTAIAFGTLDEVDNDAQVKLIAGLRWLLDVVGDQPQTDDDESSLETKAEPAEQDITLVDLVHAALADRGGTFGPTQRDEQTVDWTVTHGSVSVLVQLLGAPGGPILLRYSSPLLRGVPPGVAIAETLNGINRADSMHKAYLADDVVVLEYDQIANDLAPPRLGYTLDGFVEAADNYDTILQDRFGGETFAADVKARFRV